MDEEQVKKEIYSLGGRLHAMEFLLKHVFQVVLHQQSELDRLNGRDLVSLNDRLDRIGLQMETTLKTASFTGSDPAISELIASLVESDVMNFLKSMRQNR
jgi:hypothetical protein